MLKCPVLKGSGESSWCLSTESLFIVRKSNSNLHLGLSRFRLWMHFLSDLPRSSSRFVDLRRFIFMSGVCLLLRSSSLSSSLSMDEWIETSAVLCFLVYWSRFPARLALGWISRGFDQSESLSMIGPPRLFNYALLSISWMLCDFFSTCWLSVCSSFEFTVSSCRLWSTVFRLACCEDLFVNGSPLLFCQ